jgi:peptidyl-prolyl cis-trans isomerase B (cyclophilin B)
MVIIRTTFGEIKLELDADKAPKTVANFLSYARDGYYDGTIFHRVIDNFMIQGGGFDAEMRQKATESPIENEADNGLKNTFGTIAMARTSDPHSATAQFFINVKDNDFLNHTGKTPQGWGYAVFGKVVEGTEVLNKIRAVRTGSRKGHQDVPAEPVIIESVQIVEA